MAKSYGKPSTSGKTGKGTPSSIGNTGNIQGDMTSSEGGKLPFMPGASTYSGRKENVSSSGMSESSDQGGRIPFLPNASADSKDA